MSRVSYPLSVAKPGSPTHTEAEAVRTLRQDILSVEAPQSGENGAADEEWIPPQPGRLPATVHGLRSGTGSYQIAS